MTEDLRKIGLKTGLKQLTKEQILRVLDCPEDKMMLDTFNYQDGKFCPLAIGIGLPDIIKKPTNKKVTKILALLGYKIYNTRGVTGKFYTSNRYEDLRIAALEVLSEYKT